MKKKYEMNSDYILDVLEEEETKLLEQINDNIPPTIKFEFNKFLAIRNAIEDINIRNAFREGVYSKVV